MQYNAIVQSVPDLCVNANSTPPATAASTADVPLNQDYQERTNTGYAILTIRPIHRVTLNAGYEITSTAGHNRWLLPGGADGSGGLLMVSDIYGNSPKLPGNLTSPCPAASITVTGGCGFPGPFPDAPLSQALNWHKPSVGIAVDITKNLIFKCGYAYYDYNEKETRGLPVVTLPRDFHANTGTVSLKYSF
jgi:opacity protein-like surface antigen